MKPPQHHRKRGWQPRLSRILDHMRVGTITDLEVAWMHQIVTGLQRQADVHRKDNELMLRVLAKERQEVWDLRDENARLRHHLDLRQRPAGYYTARGDCGETVT